MSKNNTDLIVSAITTTYKVIKGNGGNTYLLDSTLGNTCALKIGSSASNALMRNIAKENSTRVSSDEIKYINEVIKEESEAKDERTEVYSRFCRSEDVVIIDAGDKCASRIVIKSGGVEVQASGELTNFYQAPYALPYILPYKTPLLYYISTFLNMSPADELLLICWITFVICHPKTAGVSTPILCLIGGQGTGKSSLCRLLRQLIDPSEIGIQKLPRNSEQLALMAQNANILIFDNVRSLSPDISDSLCATSTGGKLASRKLYTNGEEHLLSFKTAVVINGIHSFINQPDLADRCITIHPNEIPPSSRRTEADINKEFIEAAPMIVAGLLKLSAIAMQKFAEAEVKTPLRMLDFCQWIAAIELALIELPSAEYSHITVGDIQQYYSDNQATLTLDNLLENDLAAAIFDMSNSNKMPFTGTPAKLLSELNNDRTSCFLPAHQWPNNPIALSKRLVPLLPALVKHGIKIELTRGKERKVTISLTDQHPNYLY